MINIRHPYLVELYGASLVGQEALIMEYCERGSLYAVLKNQAIPISWILCFSMIKNIFEGIHALHCHDPPVFHRDLKTLNVLVTKDFVCKIGDFGLSRFQTDTVTLKKQRGTWCYMAPEMLDGVKYSTKADVYSLSMVLWEIITRIVLGTYQRPFGEYRNLNPNSVQISMVAKSLGRRPTIKQKTPAPLEKMICDSWATVPALRPEIEELKSRIDLIVDLYMTEKAEWDKLNMSYASIKEEENLETLSSDEDLCPFIKDRGSGVQTKDTDKMSTDTP